MEEVKLAIKKILADKASYTKALNYAVEYCRYALTILNEKEMRVQVLYILNNISHWRHADAKEVRQTLKRFAGIK